MDMQFGGERLRAGTARAIRQGSPGDDLAGIERGITQLAAQEREDWERTETATARADAYRIAGEFQKRIEEGKLTGEDGQPFDEERLVNEYRAELQKRVDRLNPAIRKRAQADVSQHGAYMEVELRGRFRDYQGKQRLADLVQATDAQAKAAIDAPTDVLAGIITDQAAADLDGSIELSPVQKLEYREKLNQAVWEARLDARMRDPGNNIDALRAWVDGLPVESATREQFRQAVDTRGREVKRAEDASYLEAQMDSYVSTPAAREKILANVQTYMGGRVGNYEPGQVEAALRKWKDTASWNAFNYDMQFQGFERVNPKAYGLSPEKLTLAADAVDRARITARNEQAFLANHREAKQNQAWNQQFGQKRIALLEAMRDPNFDLAQLDRLQTEIKAAQLDGFRAGDEWFASLESMRNEYQTQRDLIGQAWGAMGTGTLSQKEADTLWPAYLKDRAVSAPVNEPPDDVGLIVDFVRESGRIPEPITKNLEAAANNPYADQVSGRTIREMGGLYERIKREAPAATAQIDEKARAIYEAMEYDKAGVAITGDDEIKSIVKYVHDPDAHKIKQTQWERLEGGDKGLRKQVEKALRKGEGGLEGLNVSGELWPGIGLASGDEYENGLIADTIVERAGKLYQLSPSASVPKAVSQAAIETFQKYGLWYDGERTQWMENAPTIFIKNAGWLKEKLNRLLEARGYTMERYDLSQLGAAGAGATDYLQRVQNLKQTRVKLQWDGEPFNELPNYYIYYGDGINESLLIDENNVPVTFGGESVWKTYRNGAAAKDETMMEIEQIQQQKRKDDAWKQNVQQTMQSVGVY